MNLLALLNQLRRHHVVLLRTPARLLYDLKRELNADEVASEAASA